MNRSLSLISLVAIGLILSGCASNVDCNVVAFHELPPPAGETIVLVHKSPERTDTPEFKHYAQRIRTSLERLGYVPVDSGEKAELTAALEYGVSDGFTEITTERWPRCSVRYHFEYDRYYDPFYYGHYCWETTTRSETHYIRHLELVISRGSGAGREVLFEGRVNSLGRENNLSEIMPYLVTALFSNFPGESGVSKTVTIERDGDKVSSAAIPGSEQCRATASFG